MKTIEQQVPVSFSYNVHFTEGLFDPANPIFADLLQQASSGVQRKVLFVFDEGMYSHQTSLENKIAAYTARYEGAFEQAGPPIIIPGGEAAKNDPQHVRKIHDAINQFNIDRHSYVAAIGGGAVVDAAGYAAATAHRGIRMIRIPTTVLAQNDAAVGVKNGINAYGKKNFLGTFAPPFAVLNDFEFLTTLEDRDWRSGISEAVKVALLKDAAFFEFLEEHASLLNKRDMPAMQKLIYRCAELHLEHIATSGDPFEMGSSRPLDFGHWAGHKLEQLTHYRLRHGEAVAIGIALDSAYSFLEGRLAEQHLQRILQTFVKAGFKLYIPELKQELDQPESKTSIFHGLEEFREHLGGQLTIMLLEGIGQGVEVHQVNYELYRKAISLLQTFEQQPV